MAAEEFSRKKRLRGAHRGLVTRLLTQVHESIESDEGPNISKLKQQRETLSTKLEVLLKLDEELIGLVEEDDLDDEVGQADLVREKLI